jgi:diaminopimelate decarboxylase
MKNLELPFNLEKIQTICQKFKTPFYIYDETGIMQNAQYFNKCFIQNGFKDYANYFAVKALPNPQIMKLLDSKNMGFDCSSLAELMLCQKIGIANQKLLNGLPKIIFTSNQTHWSEYKKAVEIGAIINFDDITHINYFEKNVTKLPDLVCFRYNPGKSRKFGNDNNFIIGKPEESKFGLTKNQLFEAFEICKNKGVQKFGLHTMVASNELNEVAFVETAKMLLDICDELWQNLAIKIEFINLGGGVGIPYKPEQKRVNLKLIAQKIAKLYQNIKFPKPILLSENGRAITGPFEYLVTTTIHYKNTYKNYIGVDATMANLMRPGMYGSYHHITNLSNQNGKIKKYDVVGSLCENNDKFAVDREIPEIKIGDILIIHDGGAHSHSMGFNYNGKLRSAELLLKPDNSVKMIRRGETYDDLFATLKF